MLIFGVDPGSKKCGYCVLGVDGHGQQPTLMECGVFKAPANDNGDRWARFRVIGDDFEGLLNQYGGGIGDTCAIESAFVPREHRMGIETLAEVRGVLGYLAVRRSMRIVTVSPATVKKAVTGSGRADKEAVAELVRVRFKMREAPPADASDAVGVALAVSMGAGK